MIGILTTDADLTIRSWDAGLAEMSGIASAAAIGQYIGEVIPDLGERGLLTRFENVLRQGTGEVLAPAFHHYLVRCPPLEPARHFAEMQQHVTIAPLWEAERVAGTIVTIEDVTARLDQERTLGARLKSPDEQIETARDPATVDGSAAELVGLLGDASWRVRRDTVASLGRTADAGAIAEVLRALRSKHRDLAVLNSALQVLALNQLDVVPALVELLHDTDVDLRIYAALALGDQADQRAERALIEALRDPEPNVVYHAIESLGRRQARAAVEELAVFAESGDFFLSFPALAALTQIGDSRVAERLLPLLDDELLCEAALDALSQLGDLAVVASLARLLGQEQQPAALVCRALANLYDRFLQRYGQADYIAQRVCQETGSATATRLIALLDTEEDRLPIARVLGWLDGAQVDAALCALLRHDALRDAIGTICIQRGAAAVEHLLGWLTSGDLETRAAIIAVLGSIGDPRATPALIEVLQSEPELSGVTVDALARSGDRRAFEPVLALLGHADLTVRQAAIAAINSLGHPDTSERLPMLMRDTDPLVRESAARIAGYYGYPECAGALLACLADADEHVRIAAVEQLPYLGGESILSSFLAALRDVSPRVRAAAAHAGASIDDPEVGPALVTALDDAAPWVRYQAARSLAKRGETAAFAILARLIATDPAPHVRIAALETLGRLGREQAIDLLTPFVSDEDTDVACAALSGLGATGSAQALPIIRPALRAADPRRRMAAISALAEIGSGDAVDLIQWVAAVEQDEPSAAAAIAALGAIGSPRAITALLGLLAEPARRDTVCDALVRLGPVEVEQIARGLRHSERAIRCAVVEVLARMRHPATAGLLLAALDDPAADVRLAAVHGLAGLMPQAAARLEVLAKGDADPLVRRAARTLLEH